MNKVKLSFLIFLMFVYGCERKNNWSILEDESIELRLNYERDKGKLEIIESTSEKYKKLQNYLKNLNGFIEVETITNYPIVLLKSKNLLIYIEEEKIDLEFRNQKNNVIKLSKTFNSYEEFLELEYLWKNNNWIIDFGNIYGIGSLKNSKYASCGIKMDSIDYFYKVGLWKFWDSNRNLIAEGVFDIDSINTSVVGINCYNTIKVSKVSEKKWKFYDALGNIVKPSLELKYDIENASYNLR